MSAFWRFLSVSHTVITAMGELELWWAQVLGAILEEQLGLALDSGLGLTEMAGHVEILDPTSVCAFKWKKNESSGAHQHLQHQRAFQQLRHQKL